jgi:sugar phosphate permease
MHRNLRILPWWWVLRWPAFGEALWVIYLVEQHGFSLGRVFLLHALFVAVALTAEVPSGVFADRFGRRPSILLATALIAVGFLAFGLADHAAVLVFAWLSLALADAFMSGADGALLYETLDALDRGGEFAAKLGRFGALQNAALAVIVLAGSALAGATEPRVPFILAGAAALPAVALAWLLAEPPRPAPLGDTPSATRPSFIETGRAALTRAGRTPVIATVILVFALVTMTPEIMGLTIQPLVRSHDLPLWVLGISGAGVMLSSSIGAWLSGAAGSRWGTHRLLWTVAPLAAIVLLAGATGTPILLPLFVLPTGCWSILNPHVADYLSRRTPAGERATILSLMNLAPGVLSIGVTLALAPLIDATGLRGTLAAASLVLLALILGALTLWSRADRAASPVR